MAKFAQCGYGSMGQGVGKNGEGYTYVVNDNVRVGQKLKVISTARNKTTKFVTTAVPLHTYKENSVLGQKAKINVLSKGDKEKELAIEKEIKDGALSQEQLTQQSKAASTMAFTGGELGASGETRKKDIAIGQNKPQSEYEIATSALVAKKFQEANPNVEFSKNTIKKIKYYEENKPVSTGSGTFVDYSKPFMKEGEKL